ncbi:unnamed protein product [Rotaria sordida]|uniref:Uncharacterized protein n=1 Tax=Rotaria sordida TaxID=392033 RepID=A0A815IKX8_9BILA|nr:unnamed protein product [Rotaria sordida]
MLSPDGEVIEVVSPLLTNKSSPPSSNSEKSFVSTTGGIHHPTMIPISSSKNGNNLITKTGVVLPSTLTRAQQTKHHLFLNYLYRRYLLLRNSNINIIYSTGSSTTRNNVTRGVNGIPRLTKTSHQIIKPTTITGLTQRSDRCIRHLLKFSANSLLENNLS